MKHGIELNGVANIKLILDADHNSFITSVANDSGNRVVKCIEFDDVQTIKEQLNFLERYMIAFNDAINSNTEPPKWHDITSNPNRYPTNGERFK